MWIIFNTLASTHTVLHGTPTVVHRRRGDKTEVKSLVLPETKKVAKALADLADVSKRELFVLKPKGH